MAAASANEPAADTKTTISTDAAKKMSDTVAAAAIAQIEAEMEAEKQQQEESVGAAAKKNNVTKKKRGGSAAGSKAKKPKTTRKPRPFLLQATAPLTLSRLPRPFPLVMVILPGITDHLAFLMVGPAPSPRRRRMPRDAAVRSRSA